MFRDYTCKLITPSPRGQWDISFGLKYVLKGLIDNNAALVQIMAWCQGWGQVKYLYLVPDADCWVLGTYFVLGLLKLKSTWHLLVLGRPKYLILVQVLRYFCQINKYSVLNLWICSLQQFTTEHHNQNYWDGSIGCADSMCQDVKTGLSPFFTCKALRPDDSIRWQNSGHQWFR